MNDDVPGSLYKHSRIRTIAFGMLAAMTVILISFAVWFYYSPIYTIETMQNAYADREFSTFLSYVDESAVLSSISDDLSLSLEAGIADSDNPFDMALEEFTPAVAMSALSYAITEEAFAMSVRPDGHDSYTYMLFHAFAGPTPTIRRVSINQFRASFENGLAFVFERRFFGWQMSAISLPPNFFQLGLPEPASEADVEPNTQTNENFTSSPTPTLSADWLVGSWRSAEGETAFETSGMDWCETDAVVTFYVDGTYRDGGSFGRYRASSHSITYYDIVLYDMATDEEDRSQFDIPITVPAFAEASDMLNEDGHRWRRCRAE